MLVNFQKTIKIAIENWEKESQTITVYNIYQKQGARDQDWNCSSTMLISYSHGLKIYKFFNNEVNSSFVVTYLLSMFSILKVIYHFLQSRRSWGKEWRLKYWAYSNSQIDNLFDYLRTLKIQFIQRDHIDWNQEPHWAMVFLNSFY